MEAALVRMPERKTIEKLHVVRNFRQVIEARDISLMRDELYQFVILNSGFIAHFNLAGFKATYRAPRILPVYSSAILTKATATFATCPAATRSSIRTQAIPGPR